MKLVSSLTKKRVENYLNYGITLNKVRELINNPEIYLAIEKTLEHETSKYTDNPLDSGGKTKWGVTEKTARGLGYTGDMKDITKSMAMLIAVYKYYFKSNVFEFNDIVGYQFTTELFDASYVIGVTGTMKIVQRFLNAMNRNESYWPDIIVDGIWGDATKNAITRAVAIRGELMLIKHLRGSLYTHFLLLVERREKDEVFFNGWVANRISSS